MTRNPTAPRWMLQVVHQIESPRFPLINYVLIFFAAIFLRIYFESFTQQASHLNLPEHILQAEIVHYTLAFIAIAAGLVLLYRLMITAALESIIRVVAVGFLMLLITPAVDFLITMGQGADILYIHSYHHVNLLKNYLSYASDFWGITLGLKIEILFALAASYFYARIKRTSILRSVILVILIYTMLFLFAMLPIIIESLLGTLFYHYQFSNEIMIRFYLLLIFVLASLLYASSNAKKILRRRNIFVYLIVLLSMLIGLLWVMQQSHFSLYQQLRLYEATIINLMLSIIAMYLILMLDDGHLFYWNAILGLIYAFAVSSQVFLACSVLFACKSLYYLPPVNLKRSRLFRMILLVIVCAAGFTMGNYLLT